MRNIHEERRMPVSQYGDNLDSEERHAARKRGKGVIEKLTRRGSTEPTQTDRIGKPMRGGTVFDLEVYDSVKCY